jgi:hypothetical protein
VSGVPWTPWTEMPAEELRRSDTAAGTVLAQRRVQVLLAELIATLAELFPETKGEICETCDRALSPRTVNCPHCREQATRSAA